MIVQPLIINVIMDKKKYQLVAWTRNVKGQDDPEIRMIPSLHLDMQEPYFKEISRCQQEKRRSGGLDTELASRFVKAYEENARFLFRTGHYGDGLRFLRLAALYCIYSDDDSWVFWDTDLGSYMYLCGRLREDFLCITREFLALAEKYGRHDILMEKESKELLEIYAGQTSEERDLNRHLKKMRAWK